MLFGGFAESQSKDFNRDEIHEEPAEDYGYLSDSDLEEDEDERVAPLRHTSKPKAHSFDPFDVPGEDRWILPEEHKEHVEKGKVVKIPDMAFVT